MKLLSKRTSRILKFLLLSNLIVASSWAQVLPPAAQEKTLVSTDRYLMKILDRTLSFQDATYQLRNVKALDCIYDDSLVIRYFGKGFIQQLSKFIKDFPQENAAARTYLHANEDTLKQIRLFFKMLRYTEDQKTKVSPDLAKLIREGTKDNRCESAVLYKDTLKTNFISLLQMELYLRSRYGGQLKSARSFDAVKPSIDLFVESMDKQFPHEYYW